MRRFLLLVARSATPEPAEEENAMWLACPECREQSAFEQPPCTEGHGLDCPEWFCVTCGSAVFVGALEEEIFRQAADAAARQAANETQRPHVARQTSAHGAA